MISLKGKIALVTGGSRGIGRATAIMLGRAGADVGITYHTRGDDAKAVAKQIDALGRRSLVGGGDLGDSAVVERLFQDFRSQFGRLDLFVGNAGIWPVEAVPLRDLPLERWRETMQANLDSIYFTTRAALRMMPAGGRVILIASTAAQRGESFHADYAASKGAMIALTKSLAVECAPGITVNCVAPGWVDTEMAEPAYVDGGRDRISQTIPMGRPASPEDIAGPIVFLCSDLARHITWEVLNVNGGSVLCG